MKFRELKDGRDYQKWVQDLEGKSGVYVIQEKGALGEMLYVGESHTDRLKATLLRHFQHWTGPTKGPTFAASKVVVGVLIAPKDKAVEFQNNIIEELSPKHNTLGKVGFWERLFREI